VLETPFGVLVASRDLVDSVLQDRDGNLTATGYLPRMHRSFGALYLGMDAGQIDGTYELESVDVNAAIVGLVSAPADFRSAVAKAAEVTCDAIERLKQLGLAEAATQCSHRWEVTFEAREVIDSVLEYFCETWFGLSEQGGYLKKSGMRWNWKPGEPPCYPGHFMAPSRYTFQPHPDPEVERIGAEHGLALRVAVTKYLEAYGAGLTQPVAVAALNCAAARHDPTYPARTLAGVLMGFLPTTDGNMRRVLNEWLSEGTLWALRAQNGTIAPGDAAGKAALTTRLRRKFVEAMQLRAAPELLWRTVARSHVIGRPGQDQVPARPGQMVVASLISATQECLELGLADVYHAFGGDRRAAGHPTHACPGYGPAEAVMFGFFQGLVECNLPLRPGPAPLSFAMEGYTALPESCKGEASALVPARLRASGPALRASTSSIAAFGIQPVALASIPLLAIGDSWLYKNYFLGVEVTPSLGSKLEKLHYPSDNTFCKNGRTLGEIAQPAALKALGLYLANLDDADPAPKAVVIGGGGNDLVDPPDQPTRTRLYGMLRDNATSAAAALDPNAVAAFIDGELKGHYREILKVVTGGTTLPVLIHAYDHPIPDGTPSKLGPGPWLLRVFKARNIDAPSATDTTSTDVMKTLIDRLNAMVAAVAAEFPGRVHPLSLNGRLEGEADYATPYANYKKYWDNELHASDIGFDILARAVKAKLDSLGVR
jgi:hypothetical protein